MWLRKNNWIQVKLNSEMMRKFNRIYPDIKIGDTVKILQKEKLFDKQQKSLWSENNYEVIDIIESFNPKKYKSKEKKITRICLVNKRFYEEEFFFFT